MARLQRSQVEQDWLSRGFSCGLWTDPPGQVWEDYAHDVDELLMLLEGELELEMQVERAPDDRGRGIDSGQGLPHSAQCRAEDRPLAVWLQEMSHPDFNENLDPMGAHGMNT